MVDRKTHEVPQSEHPSVSEFPGIVGEFFGRPPELEHRPLRRGHFWAHPYCRRTSGRRDSGVSERPETECELRFRDGAGSTDGAPRRHLPNSRNGA